MHASGILIRADYRETREFVSHNDGFATMRFALTNVRTGERFVVSKPFSYTNSGRTGSWWITLARKTEYPAGDYTIGFEFGRGTEMVTTGYKARLSVRNTAEGRTLEVRQK
jgi:hypothetical protein